MEYQVILDDFQGPLDLLLHLIKEKEMDLQTLELSVITDQYLQYIHMMESSQLEVMSEYLVMAAQLIEMKSKMLLPKEKVQIEDEYQEDPREALIRRLIEYKRYKDVLDEIQEKYEKRQSMLIKPSNNMEEYVIDTSTMIPKGLEVYDLMKAMQKMYQRKMLSRPLDTHISKKDISIEQRSDQIRNYFKVRVNKRVKLDELFDRGDRYYFIVTFLSILVLANDKEVEIIQEGERVMEDYNNIIEGILYLKGDEGIDIKELSLILEISKKEAVEAMDHFIEAYSKRGFDGLQVVDFGGKYKLATNPQYFPYYQKMVEQSKATLSQAALETLAIIAYNQPITRAKVEDIRGVGCDGMIRKLIAKALIKEVGREESPGLPILYGVTDEFMDAFSLASLDELPELGDVVETESDEDIFKTKYQERDL